MAGSDGLEGERRKGNLKRKRIKMYNATVIYDVCIVFDFLCSLIIPVNLLLIDLHFSFPRGVVLFSIIVSLFFFWLLVSACFCISTVIKVH